MAQTLHTTIVSGLVAADQQHGIPLRIESIQVKNPKRNLPLALALGLALAIALYVLANLAYLRVLTVAEIAATPRVGALVAERTMGQAGGAFVSIAILLSI